MSLQELEQAVTDLPIADLDAFAKWFEQFQSDEWDRQIAADEAAGRLDEAAELADRDFEAGRCKPL